MRDCVREHMSISHSMCDSKYINPLHYNSIYRLQESQCHKHKELTHIMIQHKGYGGYGLMALSIGNNKGLEVMEFGI